MGYGMGGMMGASEGGAAAGMGMGGMIGTSESSASTGMGMGGTGMMGSSEEGASTGMMGFGYMGPSQPGYGGMGMMGGGMGMGYGMGGFGMAGIPIDVTGEMSIKPFPIGKPTNAVCEILQRRPGNPLLRHAQQNRGHRIERRSPPRPASPQPNRRQHGESVVSAMPANIAYQVYIVEVPSQREEMYSFNMTLRYISSANPLTGFNDFDFDGMIVEQFSSHETSTLVDGNPRRIWKSPSMARPAPKITGELVAFIQEVHSQVSVTGMRIEKDESAPAPFGNRYGGRRARSGQNDSPSAAPVAAEGFVNLPEGIQKILIQLLGPETKTVGYWFGNSALPGKCQTSIGVWNLSLMAIESGPSDFLLELKLTGEGVEIENTVNAKIGQPVLVGYNRYLGGMLLPGALVVIPRENFDSGPGSETPSKSTSAAPDAAAPAVPAVQLLPEEVR